MALFGAKEPFIGGPPYCTGDLLVGSGRHEGTDWPPVAGHAQQTATRSMRRSDSTKPSTREHSKPKKRNTPSSGRPLSSLPARANLFLCKVHPSLLELSGYRHHATRNGNQQQSPVLQVFHRETKAVRWVAVVVEEKSEHLSSAAGSP